jgi:hypothetical protein
MAVVINASLVSAQSQPFSGPPAIDVLGSHGMSGRGCSGCHLPHNQFSDFPVTLAGNIGSYWEETGASSGIGRAVGREQVDLATPASEITGVLLCLSCHDGNITPRNMMATRSYAQRLHLLPFVRGQSIPSFLDGQQRSFLGEHPLGLEAKIETGNGLEFTNGEFSVKPNSPYAHFVANYGWPALAPLRRSNPYGIDSEGHPYLVCTTCHNQHVMSVYVSQPGGLIAGNSRSYPTFFFVNGPYNPAGSLAANQNTNSATQFCRQCHFRDANEANNTYTIPTWF